MLCRKEQADKQDKEDKELAEGLGHMEVEKDEEKKKETWVNIFKFKWIEREIVRDIFILQWSEGITIIQ